MALLHSLAMRADFTPSIESQIRERYPHYRALSIVIRGFRAGHRPFPPVVPAPPAWIDGHVDAWRGVFRSFGSNPAKMPSSVESLWKRFQKNGALPSIDPVVDLYNALSIRSGAPFGGEDIDRYTGSPRLTFAHGDETFDTVRDGTALVEHPEPGEVIWRDDLGVTCRRWNWRQCRRTAITAESCNLWFIIDCLPPMPPEALLQAGEELVTGLKRLSPGISDSRAVLGLEMTAS